MSSAQATPFTFPAPIGGVPFSSDFAPSVVFAILYAAISIVAIYRLVQPKSRTLRIVGAVIFVCERCVIFALRARESHTPSEDTSTGLTKYWQTTFAVGYLSLLNDIIGIMRSLLVNSTLPEAASLAPESTEQYAMSPLSKYDVPHEGKDQPRARFMYRQTFGLLALFALIPIIMSTVAGIMYHKAETNASTAILVQSLRYASTGVSSGMIFTIQVFSVWSYFRVRRIRRSGAVVVAVISTLLNVVSAYRFVVMRQATTSLTSRGPHSLNTPSSKAMFYVFQAAPEWLAAVTLFSVNVREMFGTGFFGDWRITDKKPVS